MRQSREGLFSSAVTTRNIKKSLAFKLTIIGLLVCIWYFINGGFVPKFLVPKLPFLDVGPDVGPLVFFNVESDASKIRWARRANTRLLIERAMKDQKVHMVSGDILLKGQGTKAQTLTPVMARYPQTDSDMTLTQWLQHVKLGTKGIMLHFHSMEAVEVSLQLLQDFHKQHPMKYPVWLHADVLRGPHGEPPKIQFDRFRKIQKRLFPRCTVSLGWTSGVTSDLSQSAYGWASVWDMWDLVDSEWTQGSTERDEQLIVFQARLSLTHNSVPQLKWLCDLTGASLVTWHEEGDQALNEDAMHLAYRFPPNKLYLDLQHYTLQLHVDKHRHFSRGKLAHHALRRDEVRFHPEMWLKMGFHQQHNAILASSEAIALTAPIAWIITKSTYLPTSEIFIQGRFQFLNRGNRDREDYRTGLDIYIRPTKYELFEEIRAIRCFIGVGGEVEVAGSHQPEKVPDFRQTGRVTPTAAHCYRFKIVDERTRVTFAVKPLHDCTTLESVEDEEPMYPLVVAEIPRQLASSEQRPIILKTDDSKRQVLIDEFVVKHR